MMGGWSRSSASMAAATRSATCSRPPSVRSEPPKPGRLSMMTRCWCASGPAMASKLLASASRECRSTMGLPLPPMRAVTVAPSTCSCTLSNGVVWDADISGLFKSKVGKGVVVDAFQAALARFDAEGQHHHDHGEQQGHHQAQHADDAVAGKQPHHQEGRADGGAAAHRVADAG